MSLSLAFFSLEGNSQILEKHNFLEVEIVMVKMTREELTPDGIVHGSEFIREPSGSDFAIRLYVLRMGIIQ